jgi:histidinol-phosphate/aromatic aminotransferase/cobyric acid decarboxylase-like protein
MTITPRSAVADTPLAFHGGRAALPDRNTARYDFSACLNAFGAAGIVRRAIERAPIEEYPDPKCRAPREAAASQWDVPVEQIAFAPGAAELIHAACDAYLNPGDAVVIVTPAFGEYERAARLRGALVHFVWCGTSPVGSDRVSSIRTEIERVRPRLVFLCAPMTPTGYSIAQSDVRAIAEACDAIGSLLILDQAYDAFAESPLGTPALREHPATLHLRSLTKDYALAGVRVAYAIGPTHVMEALARVRVPWSASSASQAAAIATFTPGASAHVARTIGILRGEAVRLQAECEDLGFATSASTTHYFILRVANASAVRKSLLESAAICVRDCTSFGLPEYIRVAARTIPENDALLRALSELKSNV